jgi:REP element-mobilizing transposase RayT
MSHSKAKILVHGILGVKNRENLINLDIESEIYELIKTELINLNCYVEEINGTANHVHILFLLNPQKSISDIFKQVKGSVSHEINLKNITNNKFSWQVGYGAFSVSQSKIHEIINYIKNQKEHHKKMTFKEEYDKFIKLYGLL